MNNYKLSTILQYWLINMRKCKALLHWQYFAYGIKVHVFNMLEVLVKYLQVTDICELIKILFVWWRPKRSFYFFRNFSLIQKSVSWLNATQGGLSSLGHALGPAAIACANIYESSVCVCLRERERERERMIKRGAEKESTPKLSKSPPLCICDSNKFPQLNVSKYKQRVRKTAQEDC